MNLNDLFAWMSDDYRQKLEAKNKSKEARRKMMLEHYRNNYEGAGSDSEAVPLHSQWREKWPKLFDALNKPENIPDPREDFLLGNHPVQRKRHYY